MGVRSTRSRKVPFAALQHCECVRGSLSGLYVGDVLHYRSTALPVDVDDSALCLIKVPLSVVAEHLPLRDLEHVARCHSIPGLRNTASSDLVGLFRSHTCSSTCSQYIFSFQRPQFSLVSPFSANSSTSAVTSPPLANPPSLPTPAPFPSSESFPPNPLSARAKVEIIRDFKAACSKEALTEKACAVCGESTHAQSMKCRDSDDPLFEVLCRQDASVAVHARKHVNDNQHAWQTPILEPAGMSTEGDVRKVYVCDECDTSLRRKCLPAASLANGLWIGEVPPELRELNYCEKLLVARFRHNMFVVSVKMGQRRMRANAVTFSQPVAKFYDKLPPPKEDIEHCLAVIFTGPCKPTADDLKRTPLLIRSRVVWDALVWLKLNHKDYHDVVLCPQRMAQYEDGSPPVAIVHQEFDPSAGPSDPQTLAVFDDGEEKGTDDGACSFAVHALSSDAFRGMSRDVQIATALKHLRSGGKVLAYGHAEKPESIFHNPLLFPGMFPWLFPYGLGGPENSSVKARFGRDRHIRHLINYHDRRFQEDEYFLFVVFSHNQIRGSALGGFLMTKRSNFSEVAGKIRALDMNTLDELVTRGKREGFLLPKNDEEKKCFEILKYVEHVWEHVPNSTVMKRRQRSEIKSLIYHCGTPVFFITFSPADIKSPISMHLAGEDIDLSSWMPEMPDTAKRLRLVAANPVACAKFFHLMVTSFIKHVLRWDTGTDGLFGPTEAYYGTNEAQGRQTLHLHLLIWIKHSLAPQEVRDRALSSEAFRQDMIAWLESCSTGSFSTGPLDSYLSTRTDALEGDIPDPCMQLPREPPPSSCSDEELREYIKHVLDTVDEIVFKTHLHKCGKHCQKDGACRARFPREMLEKSFFDEDGALRLAHVEEWINTYTPLLTYLLRCNSDTTCLLSGTQVRAIIAYITDYITKSQLKTYTLFEVVKSTLEDHRDILDDNDSVESGRKMMTKITNALTAKLETGGPMLSASLLGNPDHYTGHEFKPFYWYSYIRFVASACDVDLGSKDRNGKGDSVRIGVSSEEELVAHSKVHDYVYRPSELSDMCLYDFVRVTTVKSKRSRANHSSTDDSDIPAAGDYEAADGDAQPDNHRSKGSKRLRFVSGHPSQGSREVEVDGNCNHTVVNFLGAVLPRLNKDPDLYYATMLMLFKPGGWRRAEDLKPVGVSLKEVFDATTFTDGALKIMRNMNLLYECLDARDDYSALRRKGKAGPLGSFTGEQLNALDVERQGDVDVGIPADVDAAMEADPAARAARVANDMQAMQNHLQWVMAQSTGNSYEVPKGLAESEITARSGSEWEDVVADAKTATNSRHDNPTECTEPQPPQDAANLVCVVSLSCNAASHNDYLVKHGDKVFANQPVTELMKNICAHFTLNHEQVRAFITIATTASNPQSQQLLMYMGGMGGTGKSQVIKALTAYFNALNERHRLLLMAPTGAAASLIHGSTYHSMLRTMQNKALGVKALEAIRQNLNRVSILFIDEVSMVSCADLKRMSENISKALDSTDAFGGLHVVVAGDFCQLPPVGKSATPLYKAHARIGTTNTGQDLALGSAIWHQFTTVVILRQNMRQAGLSERDARYREALSRVRYRRCTDGDLALFRSRVVGRTGVPPLLHPNFRDVSIITSLNANRDGVNELQSERFARDTGQGLTTFYSIDQLSGKSGKAAGAGRYPRDKLQNYLWDAPPCLVKNHVAGKLKVCIGMPVMVKHNEATELCITNGAEAKVVGWKAVTHASGKQTLEVLFVELLKPPVPLRLANLPLNVVPITPRDHYVTVELPDGKLVGVKRKQVPILPNFAMTDYGCQGRTREYNVVDLRDCKGHQSVYTCLSRGSSLDGLMILHDFKPDSFKGGLGGHLRDELFELEILDDISALVYDGKLKLDVRGRTRRSVLGEFRSTHGRGYQPIHAHELKTELNAKKRSASGTLLPAHLHKKQKLVASTPDPVHQMSGGEVDGSQGEQPVGPRWDAVDHSCAYDSFLTILVNTSIAHASMWQTPLADNPLLKHVFNDLARSPSSQISSLSRLERVRDGIRDLLHDVDPTTFPRRGTEHTDIADLARALTRLQKGKCSSLAACSHCYKVRTDSDGPGSGILWSALTAQIELDRGTYNTTGAVLRGLLTRTRTGDCAICSARGTRTTTVEYIEAPSLLVLEIPQALAQEISIDTAFRMKLAGSESLWLFQAAVYSNGSHFTSRFLDAQERVWYHDGIETGRSCILEGESLSDIQDIRYAGTRQICMVLYRRVQSG